MFQGEVEGENNFETSHTKWYFLYAVLDSSGVDDRNPRRTFLGVVATIMANSESKEREALGNSLVIVPSLSSMRISVDA